MKSCKNKNTKIQKKKNINIIKRNKIFLYSKQQQEQQNHWIVEAEQQ